MAKSKVGIIGGTGLGDAFCGEGSATLCSIGNMRKFSPNDKQALEVIAVAVDSVCIGVWPREDDRAFLGQTGV